ncbi:MAG: helix-turn-helix transcriptional regulator [Deltaproteobacteria bacterium]|nr:helix-turn-helix transcriptional regulator [Deltaproteobacteria bacterium]
MDEESNRRGKERDPYSDFLSDISDQFASKDEEKDFMENIGQGPLEEGGPALVGERIRNVREKKGLSLPDISQRTGISESTLEDIEKGNMDPPLGTVIKLAKALEMKMGYFISGEETRPFTIVRQGDRKVISRYDSKKGQQYGYQYESLAPHKKDRHMEPFMVTLEPAETEEERSSHDGQEFIYVMEGTMEVRLGEEVHLLYPGDAIYYDSTVPHLVKCHGKEATRILAVLYAER